MATGRKKWNQAAVDALQHRSRSYQFVVGVDCGTHTGLAIWDCNQRKLTHVKTYNAHAAWQLVRELKATHGRESIFVRFEDARLRTYFAEKGREALQGAGSIKRDSALWEDFCKQEEIAYQAVAPAANMTKLDSDTFQRLTGWPHSTNEHGRDAAMLVFNHN